MRAAECHQTGARARFPDTRVAEWAAEEWGVLTLDELRACGLTEDAVRVRLRKGWLHRWHRGVYAVGHRALALEGRFLAAVKACGPGAVLSHFAAAVVWGFWTWEERLIDVTVQDTTPRRHRGLKVHRTLPLDAPDAARHQGLPVTSAARTVVDLAGALPERELRRLARRAQATRWTSAPQIAITRRRLGPRRGSRALGHIIATGPAPTRSELEDVVLDVLLSGGIDPPDVNVALFLDGRRVVPDFRWPKRRLILEADGAKWHDPIEDAERQALLEAHGERVVRTTWAEAIRRPSAVLAKVR
jgi:Transcriptional regulator, AbiEi antitoxin/Protein of unknown function (DUF559)